MNYNKSYGLDIFSLVLFLLASILNLFRYTRIISVLIIFFALYRCMSHNDAKRRHELQTFYDFINKFLIKFHKQLPLNYVTLHLSDMAPMFNKIKYTVSQKLNYKIVTCPQCNQKLRLPRRKGKITVTCRRCHSEFKMRT